VKIKECTRIINLIKFCRYNPIRGSSHIPTPDYIKNKKSTLNVVNKNDDMCLRWSLLAHIHRRDGWKHANPNRVECYKPFAGDIKMEGVKEPTDLKEVSFIIH
jgi:hypothetical protein